MLNPGSRSDPWRQSPAPASFWSGGVGSGGLGKWEEEVGVEQQGLDAGPAPPCHRAACCVYSYGNCTPGLGLNRGSVGDTAVMGGLTCHGIQWPDEEVDESL